MINNNQPVIELLLEIGSHFDDKNEENLFSIFGNIIKSYIPDSIIILNQYLPGKKIILRSIKGIEENAKQVLTMLGKNPSGMVFKAYRGEFEEEYNKGEIIKFESDLYALTLGTLSKQVSNEITRELSIRTIYLLGFFDGKERLGGINIFLTKNEELKNTELLRKLAAFFSIILKARKNLQNLFKDEYQFRSIFEKSNEAIAILKKSKIILVNDAFKILMETEPDWDFLDKDIIDFIHPEEKNIIRKILENNKNEPMLDKFEFIGITQNKSIKEIAVTLSRYDYSGEEYNFIFMQDFSRRNRIECELKESETNLRNLIDTSPDLICLKDVNKKWIHANKAFLEKFKLEKYNYKGKDDLEICIVSNEYKNYYETNSYKEDEIWNGSNFFQSEEIIVTNQKSEVFDVIRKPIFANSGVGNSILMFARNITERARFEKELKNYKNHLEDLVDERAKELIKTISSLSREIAERKKAEEIILIQKELSDKLLKANTQKTVVELLFSSIIDLFDGKAWKIYEVSKGNNKLIITKNNEKYEEIFINNEWRIKEKYRKNKTTRVSIDSSTVLLFVNISITKINYAIFILTGSDSQQLNNIQESFVSMLKQTEVAIQNIENKAKLIANEKKWYSLFESMPGGSFVINRNNEIVDINDYVLNLSGFTREELIGKKCSFICNHVFHECYWQKDNREIIDNYESVLQTKSGNLIPVIKSVRKISINDEEYLIENFQNIQKQKEVEKRIEDINNCFLSFTENAYDNINRLLNLLGNQLKADCALFNTIDGKKIITVAGWNLPDNFQFEDKADGHICYALTKSDFDDILVMKDLQNTEFKETDCNVAKYSLYTYIGKMIKFEDERKATICVVYQKDYEIGEVDKKIINIVASAINIEMSRYLTIKSLKQIQNGE